MNSTGNQAPLTPVPAGWYPDPAGAAQARYWDGAEWTAHVGPQPAVVAGQPGASTRTSNSFSTAAMVLGAIALIFLPILFGPVAIGLAIAALNKKEPRAGIAMGVAVGGMILGMVIGAAIAIGTM